MTSSLDVAERKGREAFLAGKAYRDCPYEDKRTWRGAVTWSRAFRTAWFDGFDAAAKEAA